MIDKNEVIQLIAELNRTHSIEWIAVQIERSWHTVWLWSKGKRLPKLGDYELLKRLVKGEKWLKC